MVELSEVVGLGLVIFGTLSLLYGIALCYTVKGEYFNDEEVRRMLAAEAAEEKLKREEELIKEEEMAKEANQEEGKRKKRGIVIAP